MALASRTLILVKARELAQAWEVSKAAALVHVGGEFLGTHT